MIFGNREHVCVKLPSRMLEKSLVPTIREEELKQNQYFMGDDDLAEETDWIEKKSRKKRRTNTSLTPPKQSLGFSEKDQPKSKRLPKPFPIIVNGIKNFNALGELIAKMMS